MQKGLSTKLEIIADKNILPYIKTQVKNECLTIGTLRNISLQPSQSIEIHITTPTLHTLRNSGSAQIVLPVTTAVEALQVYNSGSGSMELLLEAGLLEVCNSGSGELTLAGDVAKLSCNSSGSGHVKAENCFVKEVYFNASGSGQSYFSCGEKLVGFISGSGGVYYNGNPSFVQVDSPGSGKLSKN
ncbi:GIN domain-containing protein [Chitinophaga skermanii]|uniref:GIN domain-containing protein n=1 Tax=Chitinophaga skermanii TaxID=331697 RepID=UPI001FE2BEA1|nr:DUF2807 domain-containing protein [Chitinophaga skermanii]